MKINKNKRGILHLGWINTGHKDELADEWRAIKQPCRKGSWVLIDSSST